jgi:hypothetical protein
MALSATFTANFASFYDAVDKADAKLKDFGAGADKVGARLNTLANQFSGQKIVQEATIMAKAVEEIGGVTKLTEKELARLGATTNEAVAKMKALGMEVPKNLQKIADQTKGANTATTDWLGTITKMAGAVGIAFSVGAITNFIGSVFSAASAIKDLSDQWGFSTDAVQKWTGAAKQSGVQAETVGKSIQFLTEQLAEGSEQYQALLKNVGLSYDELRKMPLEEAYRLVIAAIASIKDETLQLDVAQGLLGTSSKKMVGAIRDGLLEATEAQQYMSEETIRRLEAAESAWGKFKDKVVIYSGEMLADVTANTTTMTSSWKNFFATVGLAFKDAFSGGQMTAPFLRVTGALDEYGKQLRENQRDIRLLDERSQGLNRTVRTQAQIAEETRKKEEALRKAQAERARVSQDAKRDQEAYNKSIADLANTFSGRDVIGKAELYVEALKKSIPIQQMTTQQQVAINRVMYDAISAYQNVGLVAPKAMTDIWVATARAAGAIRDFKESLPTGDWIKPGAINLGEALTLDPGYWQEQVDVLQVIWDDAITAMGTKGPTKPIVGAIKDISAALSDLGRVSGGRFGEITEQIGMVAGAFNVAEVATKGFQQGITDFKAGNFTEGISKGATAVLQAAAAFTAATTNVSLLQSTLTGAAMGASVAMAFGPYAAWGIAIGAVTGYVRGLYAAAAERRELEAMRLNFIYAASGVDEASEAFEAFHQKALQAGVTQQQLNDIMGVRAHGEPSQTQGEMRRAAEVIAEAFQFQAQALDHVTEAAKRYGFTLEELGPAMQRQQLDEQAAQLYKDFQVLNKAGIESVAITDRMADAVNAYVRQALEMGVEVPSAMRPMLEAFARSGELLDENGEAITDLEDSGISFALTMSDGFKAMITEVKRLTDAIARGLGIAIQEIPQPQITGQVSWNVAPIPAAPNPPPAGEEVESYQRGTGGFKNFGAGTPVMLHGWEAVVPREASGAFATVSDGGGAATAAAAAPTIVINAQGAFFDTPDSLQRLATKVSDALTAQHSVMRKLRAAV